MRFCVSYTPAHHGTDPDRVLGYARHAEHCGFEGLYLPEHIVLHPGIEFGGHPVPPTTPFLDPLDTLAFVAAATDRLLLGTGVLLLPYHHPVVLAKRLATLDVLSRGRLRLLTVGLGNLAREAAAVGVDFATRGRRADEAIDVLRLLWSADEDGLSSHAGTFFEFTGLASYPGPHQGPTIPVHVGGSSRAAARRAGRRGDGWFPGGALGPTEREAQWALVRRTAEAAGRDPDAIEHTRWAPIDMSAGRLEAFADQGVTRLVVAAAAADPQEQRDELSAFAERFELS